ncbi:hypothetical protein E2F46_04390 [Luteimonas aestuarii]|uniref:Uncharacterized protein n=1 Tax=Luteimonas aestuarii TaxID=453837 RepID=A0A4R5U1J5_9GAMM|nr:hypothetical protein [Luteimonas aestuarii]TDK27434.1 hypothetical protein E2F46_04390 [Luteimonas aestuarii]
MSNFDPRPTLPDRKVPALPDTLWPKLAAAQRRRRRRFREGAQVLCAAVLLAGAWWLVPRDQPPAPTTMAMSAGTVDTRVVQERLGAIDGALQAAYEQGASDDEIEPLWRLRRSLAIQATQLPDAM